MKLSPLAWLLLVALLTACSSRPTPPAPEAGGAVPAAPAESTPVPARAARVVELKNGTMLLGTIEREEGGRLYVQADLLGLLVIDATARGRPAARPDPARLIVLKNKSRLVGTIQKEEGGKVYVDAELIGLIVCDRALLANRQP